MNSTKHFDLEDRLINFAVRIIRLGESLPNTKAAKHIHGQLLRCATSAPANYAEAQSAESRPDFIHKIKVVTKELRETKVWLLIIAKASLMKPADQLQPIIKESDELISIFVKSARTAKGTS